MLDSFGPIEKIEEPSKIIYSNEELLSDTVSHIYSSKGIENLYKHQAEAIKLIRDGKNVVISSPTASGKTEIYLSEVIDAALKGETSLILYPTKALSRDQLKKFQAFALYGADAKIYDGDTPDHKRKKIREHNPQILITNVDMLHFILMKNRPFKKFFNNLKYVVVDEVHTYSGVLGSHVSNIFWRLKRICKQNPQFILTSATVKNAKHFAAGLVGEKVELIEGSSSKRSRIKHLMISKDTQNYLTTTLEVLENLGKKSIVFGNSHSAVERLSLFGQNQNIDLEVYRAGLTFKRREEIERDFKKGEIRYLASTSALELGIDIGSVDAVILAGFPGSITKVKQRIGRAGRAGQDAYAIYIARNSPLDQYYMDNPDEYLSGEPESCYANPANEKVKRLHVLAASRDKMLKASEIEEFSKIVQNLEEGGLMKRWASYYSPTNDGIKEISRMNLRGIGDSIQIIRIDDEKLIGQRDYSIALGELYEGSIYLHSGRAYVSERLDLQNKKAYVSKIKRQVNEFTTPLKEKNITVNETVLTSEFMGFPTNYGKLHITNEYYGYKVKDAHNGRVLGQTSFDEPYTYEFDGYGFWIDLSELVHTTREFGSGLHAYEHIAISMIPALTGSSSREIGGLSYPSGTMFIYDSVPQGSGIIEVVFDNFEKITKMAYGRLKNCKCDKGCPSCIFDSLCGNDNHFLDKESAVDIIDQIMRS